MSSNSIRPVAFRLATNEILAAHTSDGRSIAFDVSGPSDAPCLMFAHGIALDRSLWSGIRDRLVTEYRVLRYDSRGHGLSTLGHGSFTLDDLAADAVAVLDAAGIATAHFVGHSMGGMVGLGLALAHPEHLLSAAICNARGAATPEYRKSWDDRVALVREGGIEAIATSTVTRWFTPQFRASHPETVERMTATVLSTAPDAYCASAQALKGLDYEERLGEVHLPMLFLTGAEDPGAPPAVVRALHDRTPGSRYAEIDGAAHISMVERPESFLAELLGFLRAENR